ncbi:hypothetical protein ANCCAN_24814 [Ancylostoma caninum]|uniref:Uncharacterized protein n=1 Tax=Ancylostoma caninum TaxID=29170 RepID=A0A368FBA2_ANCCA|nr:hypothetical protein ANCCAN_24814 [Ancylostoma caninum]
MLSSSPLPTQQSQQNLIYSTFVKICADGQKIDDKLKRITWVGIDEKADEESTNQFDREILKEVIII